MSEPLTIERIFAAPPLAGSLPTHCRISPDGALVTFLRPASDDRERMDLWCVDTTKGEQRCLINAAQLAASNPNARVELSAAEQARRERRRVFAHGIVEYEWADDGARILLPLDGVVYAFEVATRQITQLSPGGTQQTDVRLAPGAARIAYVRDGDIYVYDLADAREQRLTHDGSDTISSGLAEFIAQEEMHRFDGYWWSPDGKYIAFSRVDSSAIPVSFRYDINAAGTVAVAQRYPYAGAANASVTLFIVDVAAPDAAVGIHWSRSADDYLARVHWTPDSGGLIVQRQSRDQRTLELVWHDRAGLSAKTLLTEHSTTWINLHDNLRWFGPTRFLWTSERRGRAKLLVSNLAGELTEISGDDVFIVEVLGNDERSAFVMGWRDDPTQLQLYRIDLRAAQAHGATSVTTQLTHAVGWHQCAVAKQGGMAIDTWSNADQPPRLDLIDLVSGAIRPLVANDITQGHPYHAYAASHPTVTFGQLSADDGQTLHYRLTHPAGLGPSRRHPVLVIVYGGPGVSRVRRDWLSGWHHFLTRAGYLIFELDNRGSALRGQRFESPIHWRLGDVEVRDQLLGLQWLQAQSFVDASRIAVSGHSYGGFMTLMLLSQAPGRFAAGIATAPVCDWTLYDTHYSERYLGTPDANPEGYVRSNVLTWLPQLREPLLLVHGMADDNVLFTNTTKILAALHACGAQFDFMAYPGSKHGLAEQTVSVHRYTMMFNFLQRQLGLGNER